MPVSINKSEHTHAIFISANVDFFMAFMDETGNVQGQARTYAAVHPGNAALRRAVHGNCVSFPSQTPALLKQPAADLQWRMVLLFFVRGWSTTRMAARYHVPKHRIWKVLHDWAVRAFALGYIQVIDEEKFATCSRMDVEWSIVRGSARTHAEVSPGYMPGSSEEKEYVSHAVV